MRPAIDEMAGLFFGKSRFGANDAINVFIINRLDDLYLRKHILQIFVKILANNMWKSVLKSSYHRKSVHFADFNHRKSVGFAIYIIEKV